MSGVLKNKSDLSNRIYPITAFIQKVAVRRHVTVPLIRDELLVAVGITVGHLSQLEGAFHGQRKPPRLQLKQGMRMNNYFRQQLEDKEIYVCQMDLGLVVEA